MMQLPLLSVLLAALALVQRVAGDACDSVAYNTLTFECNDVCASNRHSCVVYPSLAKSPCNLEDMSGFAKCVSPTGDAGCVYQCFAPATEASKQFTFYVLFDAKRGTIAPPTTMAQRQLSVTSFPSEMNAFVKRIGKIKIQDDETYLVISGGRDENTGTRGSFVELEIDPLAFTASTNISLFGLININLANIPDIAAILPRTIDRMDLSNTNLQAIPASIDLLLDLEAWGAERNYFKEIPSTLKLPKLEELKISENDLTEFTANFPLLQKLELASNKLRSFPTVVFDLPKLTTLRLEENPEMATVVFTESQYAFLYRLEVFTIDDDALDRVSCSPTQRKVVVRATDATVCVVTDAEYAAYKGKPRSSTPSSPSPSTTVSPISPTSPPSSSSPSGGGVSTAVVIVLIVGGIVIGAAMVAAYFLLRKRREKYSKAAEQHSQVASEPMPSRYVARPTMDGSRSGPGTSSSGSGPSRKARHAALLLSADSALSSGQSLWDDDEMLSFQLDYEGIEDVKLIGSGGFAVVWLVKYTPHNRLLASKRLIKDQLTRQKTMEFVGEIKLGMKLHHPSIVEFVGVAWTVETDLQALFEYMPQGDLRAYLETTESDTPPPWDRTKLRIAIDVVDALVYVHSFNPPLVHRDLKSRNVLLTEELRAKLSDFGVSRFQSENGTMTSGVGTGKWLAPEVIAGSRSYTIACDIYAFGVLLSELDTHALPFDDLRGPQGNRLPEVAVMQMVAVGHAKPTLSKGCPSELRKIADQCLAFDASERPSAIRVAQALSTVMRTLPTASTII